MDLNLDDPLSQSMYDAAMGLLGGVAGGMGYNALGAPFEYQAVVIAGGVGVLFGLAVIIRIVSK